MPWVDTFQWKKKYSNLFLKACIAYGKNWKIAHHRLLFCWMGGGGVGGGAGVKKGQQWCIQWDKKSMQIEEQRCCNCWWGALTKAVLKSVKPTYLGKGFSFLLFVFQLFVPSFYFLIVMSIILGAKISCRTLKAVKTSR